jgi:Gamma-glutamyl cyclotransferase, AIG2-like
MLISSFASKQIFSLGCASIMSEPSHVDERPSPPFPPPGPLPFNSEIRYEKRKCLPAVWPALGETPQSKAAAEKKAAEVAEERARRYELYKDWGSPSLAKWANLPDNFWDDIEPVEDVAPSFIPEDYFFYATLMDPEILSRILGVPKIAPAELRPAYVVGYSPADRGPYKTLIYGPRDHIVNGVAYTVQSEDDQNKLADYEGRAYVTASCRIQLDQNQKPRTKEVRGWTFAYAGDQTALREGRVDQELWDTLMLMQYRSRGGSPESGYASVDGNLAHVQAGDHAGDLSDDHAEDQAEDMTALYLTSSGESGADMMEPVGVYLETDSSGGMDRREGDLEDTESVPKVHDGITTRTRNCLSKLLSLKFRRRSR